MSLEIEINEVIQDVIDSFTQDNESYLMNIEDKIIDLTDTLGQTKIKDDETKDENIDTEFYAVDKLLDKRVNSKGKTEYLVKWEGDYEPTWEPEDFINSILIRQFLFKKEIDSHNVQVKQSVPNTIINEVSIPPILPVAHIYLRVSDPSKTSSLFSQSKQQLPTTGTTGSGTTGSNTLGTVNGTQQVQQTSYNSYQAYFGDFPSGNFSLETQKDILFKYCKDNKFLVGSIEMDDGVSARDPTKLKGLQEVIKNIKKDETLLFLDLSRFSRNTTIGIQILDDLHKRGVKIYSVLDGMNYNTPAAQHCVRTTLSTTQLESDIKSAKLKASFQNIKRNGGYVGSKAPYGFKVIRDGQLRKLVENSNEQKVLNIIKECKNKINTNINTNITTTKSQNNSEIAKGLNAKGLRLRGKLFTSTNISNLVNKHFKDILPKEQKEQKEQKVLSKVAKTTKTKKSIEKTQISLSSSTSVKEIKTKEIVMNLIKEKNKKTFSTSSSRINKTIQENKEKRHHSYFTRRTLKDNSMDNSIDHNLVLTFN